MTECVEQTPVSFLATPMSLAWSRNCATITFRIESAPNFLAMPNKLMKIPNKNDLQCLTRVELALWPTTTKTSILHYYRPVVVVDDVVVTGTVAAVL